MLERFLKFLKRRPHKRDFDGSYLDHLLEEVYPSADAAIEACSENDPLLVVVTEILRQTQPERWPNPADGPVADAKSPALVEAKSPPASPPPPPGAPADVAGDDDAVDDDAVDDDAVDDDAADDDAVDDGAVDDDAVDDDAVDETDDNKRAADSLDDADRLDDGGAQTDDADGQPDSDQPDSDQALAVDAPEVLQAGRVFLGLLIENDRLPIDMQLSVAETMLARDLLMGYFVGDVHPDHDTQDLLGLVEQKFNDGSFSQARILLELFQSERPTRINNDRNLFYEEMILRLGVQRPQRAEATISAVDAGQAAGDSFDARFGQTAAWFDSKLDLTFHIFTRDRAAVDRWRDYASRSSRQRAADVFSRYLPPKCWRPAHLNPAGAGQGLVDHVSPITLKRYIMRQLKACYFVLRAVGDTGLEHYLDDFFDWADRHFDFNAVRMMPVLNQRVRDDAQLVDDIFADAFQHFFADQAAAFFEAITDEDILAAGRAAIDSFEDIDLEGVPPGHHDLGGFIYDELFELDYFEPAFGFKLHRLT